MKKIIATILGLIIAISVFNISVFAVSEDSNELNPEKSTQHVSRRRISEETKSNIRKEFKTIKDQNPKYSNIKVYKMLSEKFNISASSVKRFVLPPEEYEKYRKHSQQYRENNKEKLKESHKLYYEKNQDRLRKYSRQYYEENKEKCHDYSRQYYIKNRDRCLENSRQTYKKNKEKEIKQREEWERKFNQYLKIRGIL